MSVSKQKTNTLEGAPAGTAWFTMPCGSERTALEDRYKSENEEKMKATEPSDFTREMHKHYNLPDVVREDKMRVVRLRFYDEVGFTAGKNCKVKNMYKCPYGEESEQLVEDGGLAKIAWELVEWYDTHWNRSRIHFPLKNEERWYHYDEPSLIDVTSYEDIMKATEDGRLLKILEEFEMHEKETGSRY